MTVASPSIVPTPSATAARHRLLPLLEAVAARGPASPALLAPGFEPLCYADLVAQVTAAGTRLRSLGLGAGDRVAIALRDSPAAALMMVSAVAHCAAVPVNPRSTQAEVERLLTGVKARALVVADGTNAAARLAAERVGLMVIDLRAAGGGVAGKFDLEPLRVETEHAEPQDAESQDEIGRAH